MSISDQCIRCSHYRLGGSCGAFDKIPAEIIEGQFDHRKAYPSDRGVRWSRCDLGERKEK